jgi:hypothetical protein
MTYPHVDEVRSTHMPTKHKSSFSKGVINLSKFDAVYYRYESSSHTKELGILCLVSECDIY